MVVTADNVGKVYGKGPARVQALRDVSFNIKNGEFISFVGPSGSGKSTLLNLIGGMDISTSGSLLVAGTDLAKASKQDLVRHRRSTVGMVFQSFNLVSDLTAVGNITFALTFGGLKRNLRKKRARDLITMVGLEQRSAHTPAELSGGEAQRVAIARAMCNNPRILLADEPTGNLDSKTSRAVMDLISSLNSTKGVTVIMVTHDIPLAKSVSHRIIHLLDGCIEKETRVSELP